MGLFDSLNKVLDPGDLFGARASKRAGDVQAQMSAEALQLQKDLASQLRADQAPVLDFRNRALELIKQYQGGGYTPIADPGTEYATQQQERNVNALSAATGKLGSGGRLMKVQDIRAGAAANSTNNALDRLLNMGGFSTTDLNTQNSFLQGNVNQQAALEQDIGNARASGIMGAQNGAISAVNALGYPAGYLAAGRRRTPTTSLTDGLVYD
jgi:hypothetical protein